MQDSRTSTGSQKLDITFDTLIESPEAHIAAIRAVKSEKSHNFRSRDIAVSVQEMFFGSKAAAVGNSAKPLDRESELISSSEEALRPRRDRGSSERFNSNVCQRKISTNKNLVKKLNHFITG
ncbi:hypothetical protein O181_126194 [Austropuccinia psidii MF-1]|uniref:Uncharacterized protein n=1 Tax=Austropuccinia psidii MF-1 TaxID=1389203 RepID=A0A9Q3KVK5_9BASI|nr:hypothetical protein [Austropuccinia psidii MF-1]